MLLSSLYLKYLFHYPYFNHIAQTKQPCQYLYGNLAYKKPMSIESLFTPQIATSAGGIIISLYLGWIIYRIISNHFKHFELIETKLNDTINKNNEVLTRHTDAIEKLIHFLEIKL